MPTFKYVAKNSDSNTVTGKITAENRAAVIEELRKRQLIIISVEEGKAAGARKFSFLKSKVKPDDLVIFARQLATMVEAGIPILQGLDALQDQASHPTLKKVLAQVRDDIQLGNSLSASFAKHPQIFDPLFVNMIRVGETGGVLSAILDRIASYMEKTLKLKRKVKAALVYPAVVISMAAMITTLLLVKVVPTFASIYTSFDRELPSLTQFLINVSNFAQKGILFILFGLGLLIYGLGRWYKTPQGALAIDHAILKIPIFGELFRKVAISRFSRTLGTMLQSGVPILECLEIVGKSIGNRVIELIIENVKNSVREGTSIAAPLLKSDIFPSMVTRMIAVGEKSGQLEKMLFKIAEFFDDQVDAAVDALSSIIEPVIIGILGIVIGFIVIALFLPIVNIIQVI